MKTIKETVNEQLIFEELYGDFMAGAEEDVPFDM